MAGALDRLRAEAAAPDVLYTCAAVQPHGNDGPVADVPVEVWHRVLAVNLTGTFLCCKHAIPLMAGRGGSIILCGSPTALTAAGAGASAYAASKGGVLALTDPGRRIVHPGCLDDVSSARLQVETGAARRTQPGHDRTRPTGGADGADGIRATVAAYRWRGPPPPLVRVEKG